jgi:hypothetical protein
VIVYRNRWRLRIGESWYTDELAGASADIVHYFHLKQPLPGGPFEEFTTLWLDLTQPEESIFEAMNRTTRYEIRRAADCGLRCDSWFEDSAAHTCRFADFYDAFTAQKRLPPARRDWLAIHAAAGVLDLSCVSAPDGEPLVWHLYYRDRTYARLRQSASLFRDSADPQFRALAGKANRLLHWEDMKRFKNAGATLYDFGGWYAGAEDRDLLAINQFKEGFGGKIVKTFHCTRALTLPGKLYLAAVSLRRRLAGN